MAVTIPEKFKDLLSRDKKAFAHLGLAKKDGGVQLTPDGGRERHRIEWLGDHASGSQ